MREQIDGRSKILIATSTPSTELAAFSRRYAIPLHVNPQRIDIATDWNFALTVSQTTYVTLAHQDDVFAPSYVTQLSSALDRHTNANIAFCNYLEHTAQGPRNLTLNLKIKRFIIRLIFRSRECIVNSRDKRRLLSFGNPICCPSVMLNRELLGNLRFPSGFQTNLDWMAWLELARRPGGFVYVPECLVSKRIHSASETTATIASLAREREDLAIFKSIWPSPIAATLATLYKLGYRANRT